MASKARPQAAKRVLDECWQTGMRQTACLFVDGDPSGYDFTLPDNWTMVKQAEIGCTGNLYGAHQYGFTAYPGERVYGWMADDNHPVTPYWSYIIEDIADPWYLVHCRDMWVSEDAKEAPRVRESFNLGGGICWGGELLRSVGWWAPPGIVQGCLDWTWTSLVGGSPLGVYLHNVTVTHDNWMTGKRKKDAVDAQITAPYVQKDKAHIAAYLQSNSYKQLKERVFNEYRQYLTG